MKMQIFNTRVLLTVWFWELGQKIFLFYGNFSKNLDSNNLRCTCNITSNTENCSTSIPYFFIFLQGCTKGFSQFEVMQHKSIWNNAFWYAKVYIFWKFIQYPMHWDKIHVKKIPSDKKTLQKTQYFFFHKLLLIIVLLLICNFYMSWSTRFLSPTVCEFSSEFIKVWFFV